MADPQGPAPLELARMGRPDALLRSECEARGRDDWSAALALEHALAWLLAGDPTRADDLVLEADRLEPSFALIPDPWGLWPAPPLTAGREAEASQARDRLRQLLSWRQATPQRLWGFVWPQLQADWVAALTPERCADALLLLGHASGTAGPNALDPPLEVSLNQLVDDAAIAAHPAAACRFWQLVALIRPSWDLARIRAADLSLARGDLEACARFLAEPPAEALSNPWLHDVTARLALEQGAVATALDAWSEAIRCAESVEATRDLGEVFERRRLDARRGPAVLEVRRLASLGEQLAARLLLDRLLGEDPDWPPLLTLAGEQAATPATIAAAPSDKPPPSGSESFAQLLDRAAARLRALGLPLAPDDDRSADSITAPAPGTPIGLSEAADELAAFSRRLSDYEARFALA